MSVSEIERKAFATASTKASNERDFALRKAVFTLDQHNSMGLKSDEYGGKKCKCAPRASISWRIVCPL